MDRPHYPLPPSHPQPNNPTNSSLGRLGGPDAGSTASEEDSDEADSELLLVSLSESLSELLSCKLFDEKGQVKIHNKLGGCAKKHPCEKVIW